MRIDKLKIDKYFHLYSRKNDVVFEEIEKPELRQKGKWVNVAEDWRSQLWWWECSECGYDTADQYTYCPNCGADMRIRGEQNG